MNTTKVCLVNTSCMQGGFVKVSESVTHNVSNEHAYIVSSMPARGWPRYKVCISFKKMANKRTPPTRKGME